MAYTQSGMERRKSIAGMAQALSGAKLKTAGLETERGQGRANRFSAMLGKGMDIIGGIGQQKMRGKQELEQIGARGEEERLGLQEQYAPGSSYVEWDKKRQEALAKSDFEGTKVLHEWLDQLSPEKQELYFRMLRSGTITTEDPDGLDGKSIIAGMFLDYSGSAEARGEVPNEAGFRAWVDAELQPMPGFKNYTSQQARSLKESIDLWAPSLFQAGAAAEAPAGGARDERGLYPKERENEDELLRKLMDVQSKQAGDPSTRGANLQGWQNLIEEVNQPGYVGQARFMAIIKMIRKLTPEPVQEEPGITEWERPTIQNRGMTR